MLILAGATIIGLAPRSAGAIFIPPQVTHVPPVVATSVCVPTPIKPCEPLEVDGRIGDLEYADATRAPLQDFAGGNPTGKMFILQGSPERLNVALRVFRGNACSPDDATPFEPGGCGVWQTVILLDARRDDTLTNLQAATEVRQDDRAILLTHHSAKHFDVQYFRGSGGQWVPANGNEAWPAIVATQPKGQWLEIELEILLRPAGSNVPSEVIGNGKMGLGVFHFRYSPPEIFTLHYWPGNAGIDPVLQLVNAPNYFIPYTWATVEFAPRPAVPLSLMTYNVGLVPLVANGGTGDVMDFAIIAATVGGPEIMCFQEVWDHDERRELAEISDVFWKLQHPGDDNVEIWDVGLPQECGGLTDPFCDPEEMLIPGYGGTGLTIADTGLLLLSKNPVFGAEVREYSDFCAGADCLEAKGALWARVGTSAARKVIGESGDKVVYDAEEYVDVFCTHIQAHCDDLLETVEAVLQFAVGVIPGGYGLMDYISLCDEDAVLDVQASQFSELRTFIDEKAQPPDRPAFVMGDFNASGNEAALGTDRAYGKLLSALGLLSLTPFDAVNTLFSKRYDLALGCVGSLPYAVPPVIPTPACTPLLTPAVFEFAQMMMPGAPQWPRLGVGTNISDDAYCDVTQFGTTGDLDSNRYDHVLIYPAKPPPGELPLFAIGKDPEPHVIVDTHPDPNNQPACLSDHKAVIAHVGLVRLEDKLTFNPNMRHEIRYAVTRVENLTGDAAGGAEFYSKMRWRTETGTLQTKSFGVFKDDTDVIYPNWGVKRFFAGAQTSEFQFELWEEDWGSNPDDHYLVMPWHQGDVWSRFFHDTSLWELRNLGGAPMDWVCLEALHPSCQYHTIPTMSLAVAHTGGYPGAPSGSDRASIIHGITAVEAP